MFEQVDMSYGQFTLVPIISCMVIRLDFQGVI